MEDISPLVAFTAGLLSFLLPCVLPLLPVYLASLCGSEVFEDKGLVILAVDIGESSATVERFMESYGISFPVLLDINQDVALQYNIRGIPTTFLIDKDDIIQAIKVGAFSNKAAIEKSLSTIIP